MHFTRRRAEHAIVLGMLLAVSSSLPAGAPPPVEPGDLLASTGSIGAALIEIDPDTGAGSFRFALNSLGPVTAIDFRADGTLFGTTGAGTSNVILIDPDSGSETLVGQHTFGAVNGLAFVGGTLYGSFFGPDAKGGKGAPPTFLVTVNQADGQLTTIGELAFSPVRGLAWDAVDGILYGIGEPAANPEGQATDTLFTIDPTNAQTTAIGDTGRRLGGLTFGPDGLLYAADAQISNPKDLNVDPHGVTSAGLYVLDAQTAVPTLVGETSFAAISGLAFVPSGAPPSADLSLTKTATPVGEATLGTSITYALEVSNAGPDPATGVVVTDTLPAQVMYQSNNCGATEAGGTVTWNVGALGVSATAACDIVVTANALGTAINSATAQANEDDPNGANDTGSVTTNIVAGGGIPDAQPVPAIRGTGLLLMLLLFGGIGMVLLARRTG